MERKKPKREADAIDEDPYDTNPQHRVGENSTKCHAATDYDAENGSNGNQSKNAADPGNVRMQQKNAGCNRDQPDHKECADHCHQPRVPLTQEILIPADAAAQYRIGQGAALRRNASCSQHNDKRDAADHAPAQQVADEFGCVLNDTRAADADELQCD